MDVIFKFVSVIPDYQWIIVSVILIITYCVDSIDCHREVARFLRDVSKEWPTDNGVVYGALEQRLINALNFFDVEYWYLLSVIVLFAVIIYISYHGGTNLPVTDQQIFKKTVLSYGSLVAFVAILGIKIKKRSLHMIMTEHGLGCVGFRKARDTTNAAIGI